MGEPADEPLHEATDERAARHALEGRLQYATVTALTELKDAVTTQGKQLAKIEGWLMGSASPEGKWSPGVLQTVAFVRGVGAWIVGLLGAIATATVSMAVHAIFFGGKP